MKIKVTHEHMSSTTMRWYVYQHHNDAWFFVEMFKFRKNAFKLAKEMSFDKPGQREWIFNNGNQVVDVYENNQN